MEMHNLLLNKAMPKYKFIDNAFEIDRNKWNEFVLNHSNGNIFQTAEYYDTMKSQINMEPVTIFLLDDKNEIQGLMIGTNLFENKIYKIFTKRTIFMGSPLVKDGSIKLLALILEGYRKAFKYKTIYSEFRQICQKDLFFETHFENVIAEKRLNIIVDLKKSDSELFNLIASKRKKQIKKGFLRGCELKIYEGNDHQIIEDCYKILQQLYSKIGLPLVPLDFFLSATKYLKQRFKIFTVYYDHNLVGFHFVLCHKKYIYDWFAASKEEYYDKYPNDILSWEIIKWGSENGYELFDMGGAGKPGEKYGVRDFKLTFGGELISIYRYKIVHNPLFMSISSTAFQMKRKLNL